jgi:hypothetical protein
MINDLKTYSECLKEITEDDLHKGLLGHGLFYVNLPDFLTSSTFYEYAKEIKLKDKTSDFIRYSSMRNINTPRYLGIPEPFAYAMQVLTLKENWSKLTNYFSEKTEGNAFKYSRIHLRKKANESKLTDEYGNNEERSDEHKIFDKNYNNTRIDGNPELDLAIKSKYIAEADIANCFPSMYSHSISWALVGKTKAKQEQFKNKEYFNQIDLKTRNLKSKETNGILIGPDSSSLISEIILIAIDAELQKKGFKYTRNIDDYKCYVESYDKAEEFFRCLGEELKKYELQLNSKKFKITQLPQSSTPHWIRQLKSFNFIEIKKDDFGYLTPSENISLGTLQRFTNLAVELMLENNQDAAILNYAIKIIAQKELDDQAKIYYLKKIHHWVLIYPYLTHQLQKHVFSHFKIEKEVIQKIAQDLYDYGLKNKIYEACSYSIYWAIKHNFEVKIDNTMIIATDDCIFLLISYLYEKHKKSDLQPYIKKAHELQTNNFEQYWLYVYEVLNQNEISDTDYKTMKAQEISFIKPDLLLTESIEGDF